LFIPFPSDPRRHARAITFEIVAVGIIVILAMWAMVIASITAAREAAMDRTRSEGHNLAVAFADEVTHILDGVAGAMEAVVQRMRAAHGQFDIYGWGHAIPLLSSATVQEGIIGPDGRLVSTTLDPAPQPIDLGPRGRISLVGLDDIIRASFTRENPDGPTDIGSWSNIPGHPACPQAAKACSSRRALARTSRGTPAIAASGIIRWS
jgi:hypothetical protein